MPETPDPVDLHIGAQVRARRKRMGMSQEQLASELRLTFQQVQKYERGANRISGSKLWAIARALKCSPGGLFPEQDQLDDGKPDPVAAMAGEMGGLVMAELWLELTPSQRLGLERIAQTIRDVSRKVAA